MSTSDRYVFGTIRCDSDGCTEKVEGVRIAIEGTVAHIGAPELPDGWTKERVQCKAHMAYGLVVPGSSKVNHYCIKCSVLR